MKDLRVGAGWEAVIESGDDLGECPVWSAQDGQLYRIDVSAQILLAFDPDTGAERIWPLPARPGSFALRVDGGAVLALKSGFSYLDFDSEVVTPRFDPEPGLPGNRFNDGSCDRAGRFFAGTMDDAELATTGSLYRLDPDGRCERVLSGLAISNGIGWSPDGTVLYHVDSPRATITSYAYDARDGTIADVRGTIRLAEGTGWPDGLAVDTDGGVWVAIWDGFRVVRFLPDGTIDRVVELPVPRPTSCELGGPDLRTLYITSARAHLTDEMLRHYPLSGSLFSLRVPTPGLLSPRFAG